MKSGIYIITNIVNGKSYIGSSLDYLQRIRQHKYSLRKGTHYNNHLQSSFNKHAEKNFTFELLEYKRRTGDRNYENFKRLCVEMHIEKSSELLGNLEADNQQLS